MNIHLKYQLERLEEHATRLAAERDRAYIQAGLDRDELERHKEALSQSGLDIASKQQEIHSLKKQLSEHRGAFEELEKNLTTIRDGAASTKLRQHMQIALDILWLCREDLETSHCQRRTKTKGDRNAE